MKMRSDNEFLMDLIGKLEEIAGNTADMNTASEINEFIEVIVDRLR